MFDPYRRDAVSVSDPANDLFLIVPSNSEDLPRGLKAIRIWNPTESDATLTVTTMGGTTITIPIAARTLWVESLRIRAVKVTGTTAALVLHGYTD